MECKKINYLTPKVSVVTLELGSLMENVSFNPDEKGELDAKTSNFFDPDATD